MPSLETVSAGLNRRDVLRLLASGIVVTVVAADDTRRGSAGTATAAAPGTRAPAARLQMLSARLHIGADGQVTVFTGKVEVGQGSRTELTQVAAEELRLSPDHIRLVMADTDLVPDDGGTSGSRTTPATVPQVRRAAAAARELLLDLAAARWGVSRDGLAAADGRVLDRAASRSLGYGELAEGQQLQHEIGTPPETPAEAWRVCGTSLPRVDAKSIVTGAHRYTSDLHRPGMLYAKVVRPPAFGARLLSVDTHAAAAMPGVVVVHEGDFLGVAAPSEWQAHQAAAAIPARWETPAGPSSRTLYDDLKKRAQPGDGGRGDSTSGSIEQGLAAADLKLAATYTVAYIAHSPLEPRAAVAEWHEGALTVWTGTQQPFGVRDALAETLSLPPERVRVIVPDTGSGYGGKHRGDAAVEAARIAKVAGKPVKIVWTREEEFTWAYFRPAGVIEIRSGATRDGKLLAWEMTNYNSGGSALASPWYDVPNTRTAYRPCDAPLRTGAYRGLAATANHFARESHLDEVAAAAGVDPLAFRLRHLKDDRLRAVLEATAAKFGWEARKAAPGRGFGLACGHEKGSYVATCVEVEADRAGHNLRVLRVTQGFECGAILNPDNLRNQIEGAVLQGLGGALREQIAFADGKITNPSFATYPVTRFSDVPAIEVVLLDRKDLPSVGGGETPIVGIAPAVANALFQATGKRVRSMPLLAGG
jgi:isoquinoline 1-oxidoreductase